MNTMLKRMISLVLCFVMLVGYVPVSAFATEDGETAATVATEAATEPSVVAAAEEPAAETTEEKEPEKPGKPEGPKGPGKEEKPEGPEKPEKPEKPGKHEKEEKPEAPEKPEKPGKPEKPEKPGKPEKPEKPGKPGEETVPETTEATVPVTEETVPETTEATVPVTEETVPETTEAVESDDVLDTLDEEVMTTAEAAAAALENLEDAEFSEAALEEAQSFIDALTINNKSNDPATVVKNFGTHFTWDNENREDSKSYLFDWSYYNGVVFEGLEYLYEATGKQEYKDYVKEYMSSMINADGTWATCTNNTSKQCAGYNSTHGADCYKTASLLLDLYEMTNDSRYLTMAATLYADLDSAASKYSLSNAGNNYRHTWSSDPSPDLWLDGLYMILPFRAEYAKHIGDTEELNLIVSRLQWVSDNMYNKDKGLFYHAADSADSNSGSYWLRAIGWYAAAIADVMDSMSGENLDAMKVQLKKLVDGMLAVQNTSNGMWLNNMNAAQSSTNPYETSGTALVCYAVMKAVNNDWLDEEYVGMVKLAFNGICENKLSGTTLKDICFKGAPGSGNSTFYDNEGKGVGPFIMLYAEILKYLDEDAEQPEETLPTEPEEETKVDTDTGVTVTAPGITGLTVGKIEETAQVEQIQQKVAQVLNTENLVMLDISVADFTTGSTATVVVPVPAGMDVNKFGVYYVPAEGELELMPGEPVDETHYKFTTTHFSTYVGGVLNNNASVDENNKVSGTDNLPGAVTFDRVTSLEANTPYLIVPKEGYREGNEITLTGTKNGAGLLLNGGLSADNTNTWYYNNGTIRYQKADGDYLRVWSANAEVSNSNRNTERRVSSVTLNNIDRESFSLLANNQYLNRYNGATSTMAAGYRDNGNTNAGSAWYFYKKVTTAGTTVNFAMSPKSMSMSKDSAPQDLTYSITLGNQETVNTYNIEWETSNSDVATVANGKITAVGGGDAEITARLTSVNGHALSEAISLTVDVTVTAKSIDSINVNGAVGFVPKNNNPATVVKDAHDNAITVTVTYDDNTSEIINLTVSMLNAATPNVKGEYGNLTVTYGDKTDSPFTLNVVDNPGENFPEYPEEGSVDVNKVIGDVSQFQNTGVAEVQLSTSGIPMRRGVDVVLVADISNSMGWVAGSFNTAPTRGQTSKWKNLQTSAGNFVDILLADYEDGASGHTVSFVTFGGYDPDRNANPTKFSGNFDSVRTLFTSYSDAAAAKAQINSLVITGDDDAGYTATINGADAGEPVGGTNYDYAFLETASAIKQIKADYANAHNGESYDESGREIYVVFMTDGAPSHYNQNFYQSRDSGKFDYYALYKNSNDSIANYGAKMAESFVQHDSDANRYYMPSSGGAVAQDAWTAWLQKDSLAAAEHVLGIPSVNSISAIGFDLKNGGFNKWQFETATLISILEDLGGKDSCQVMTADDPEQLDKFYTSMARSIRQAATNAYFVDQMGASFDLQLGNYITKFKGTTSETTIALNPLPEIKVMTYNIYKKSDIGKTIGNVTVTQAMVGQRYGNPTVVETVVFSADGKQAFSSADGYTQVPLTDTAGKPVYDKVKDEEHPNGHPIYTYTGENILNNGVITAKNFWYNTTKDTKTINLAGGKTYDLAAESFYWNIGTISDKEFVLSYYVYLVNSAEGRAPAGTYPTNTEAILHYTNWLDNDVSQDTQSPVLAWKSASVYYGFYLVDSNGNPVVNQATGQTGSFTDAVKVSNRVFYEEVMLNSQSNSSSHLKVTSTVVPDEYEIYDTRAEYTVTIDSGNKVSGWEITNGKNVQVLDETTGQYVDSNIGTTYVTDYHGTDSSNATKMNGNGYSYTSTTVWFAVVWKPQALPDTVVIDYGLPVDITVLSNDMFGSAGALTGIGLVAPTLPEGQAHFGEHNTSFGTSLSSGENGLKYGTAAISGSKVRYTPNTMQMPGYDKFVYEAQYKDPSGFNQYHYADVTVIPATTIYYEDSFLAYTSYTWDTANKKWGAFKPKDVDGDGELDEHLWVVEGETKSATQAEDRPGQYALADANNIYGYDGANLNMSTHSLGSAMKATVDYDNYAEASFTFYGTGFDIVSMTDKTTGTIVVEVQKDNNGTWSKFESYVVDTFYGYTKDANGNWVVNSEPNESIYQVPVIKMADKPYARYKVTIKATYDAMFDHVDPSNTNGSYDFYLDAIRIYDPANDGAGNDKTIENAYKEDKEGWPSYLELRNKLISANKFGVEVDANGDDAITPDNDANGNGVIDENEKSPDTIVTGLVFIDGVAEVGDAKIRDYISYGPNNEVYLAPGQRVAFRLSDVTKPVQDVFATDTPKVDAQGNPVYVQDTDEDGTPKFDDDGKPVYKQAIDENGNPKVDENDNPVYEQVIYKAGTPKVDVNGNPVYVQKSIVDSIHIGLRSADSRPASYTFTNIAAEGSTNHAEGNYYNPQTKTLNTTTDMYYDLTAWKDDIIVISNYNTDTTTTGDLVITNIKATYKENPNAVVVANGGDNNDGIIVASEEGELPNNEVGVYMTRKAAALTLRALNGTSQEEIPEEPVPETPDPEQTDPVEPTDPEVTDPEETEPEETEPEETKPDKEAEKIQKEIEKALKKAAKEAEKIAKELQKAAEKAAKEAAKAISKLFKNWF